MDWVFDSYGGRLSQTRPLFIPNNDGGYDILLSTGSLVYCISSITGELLSITSCHKANIISMCSVSETVEKENSKIILSSSTDGNLFVWNYPRNHKPPIEINIQRSVHDMIPINTNEIYMVFEQNIANSQNSQAEQLKSFKLVLYDISLNKVIKRICQVNPSCQSITKISLNDSNLVSSSSSFNFKKDFIIAMNKSKLIIWSHHSRNIISKKSSPVVSNITCICSSQHNDDILVTGHKSGEILIWRNLSTLLVESETPICTRLHWHAHRVLSIALSRDGSQLYSGGEEGVLVLWKTRTAEHTFLPRLGGAISAIVQSDDGILVATKDNSIRIVNPAR